METKTTKIKQKKAVIVLEDTSSVGCKRADANASDSNQYLRLIPTTQLLPANSKAKKQSDTDHDYMIACARMAEQNGD